MSAADVVAAVLLPLGGAFAVLGGLGLVRLPDITHRLQAVAKPQTLGMTLILVGSAVRLSWPGAAVLLLIAVLQLATTPIVTVTVGRVASDVGELDREFLVVDERPEQDGSSGSA